jgi:DnaK suppressor protein
MLVKLESDYNPSELEVYMNPKQREFFRHKLLAWKNDLLNDSQETINHLKEESWHEPDLNDRATKEMETSLELKTRDRYRKLLEKIDSALKRIENDEYGYCKETGEEIGLKRLIARPIATLSIEAQQNHENYERQHSDLD